MDDETRLVPREGQALRTIEPRPFSPLDLPWAEAAREPQLRDYLIVLRKHQWLILAFLLTIVSIVTIASFKMRPVYEAVARVEIDKENPDILPFPNMAAQSAYTNMDSYIETRAKILQSETLALQTIKSLALEKHPEFIPERKTGLAWIGAAAQEAHSQHNSGLLKKFVDRLGVRRVRKSNLLELRFEARDPILAARIVNAHLENFVEHNFRTRYEATVQASNWLATQLDELKIKVEKSEDGLVAYEGENQIWAIDEKQNITTQKLADLNRELTLAQGDRIQKEAAYQLARSGNIDAIPATDDSEVIKNLLTRRVDLKDRHTEAVNQFGPRYPKVLRLQAQLKDLDELLEGEKQNIVGRIESEYRTARERERLLTQALEQQKRETNEMSQKLVQYNILKREAETNKQLYEGLLQRIKEAGISAGLRSSNIRVVDPALVPSEPARPRKARNILLAILLGLMGGVSLAFLRERLDNTVKTPEDVQDLTRLPSLAVVPEFVTANGRGRLRGMPKLLKTSSHSTAEPTVELIAHQQPHSHISEAFRALRTSLLLSQAEHPPQVILVTSSLPQEGKTTTVANLAVTLAQLGDRTLLVDGDLRKPGLGKALGLHEGKHSGLSSYLAGRSSLDSIISPHGTIANLAAIPTGPVPPNPAELLSSCRLQEAIASLRREYKFILLDSPPVLSVTDAVILSVLADCVLLVARSGETPKEAFIRTRDLLAGVKCQLLGVILNAVDFSSPHYYYSYKYYPYSYGEEEPRHSKP